MILNANMAQISCLVIEIPVILRSAPILQPWPFYYFPWVLRLSSWIIYNKSLYTIYSMGDLQLKLTSSWNQKRRVYNFWGAYLQCIHSGHTNHTFKVSIVPINLFSAVQYRKLKMFIRSSCLYPGTILYKDCGKLLIHLTFSAPTVALLRSITWCDDFSGFTQSVSSLDWWEDGTGREANVAETLFQHRWTTHKIVLDPSTSQRLDPLLDQCAVIEDARHAGQSVNSFTPERRNTRKNVRRKHLEHSAAHWIWKRHRRISNQPF